MSDKLSEIKNWIQGAVEGGFNSVTIPTANLVYLIQKIDSLKNKNKWLNFQLEREIHVSEQLEKEILQKGED